MFFHILGGKCQWEGKLGEKVAKKAAKGGPKGAQGDAKEAKRLPKRLTEEVWGAFLEQKGSENCILTNFCEKVDFSKIYVFFK